MKTGNLIAILVAVVLGPVCGRAFGAMYVPPGLNPGDAYQLVFVSSTAILPASGNIADYDAHVQAAADAAGIGTSEGVTWHAIGSTATVDAIDHVGATAPVYRLDGDFVVDGVHMWAKALDGPIMTDEYGQMSSLTYVWTGTSALGRAWYPLGGSPKVCAGHVASNWVWCEIDELSPADYGPLPIYGLSEELTVPIPEPATVSLLGLGAVGLIVRRRRSGPGR